MGGAAVIGRAYLSMALLRLRPQDMPASSALLALVCALYTLTNLLVLCIDLPLNHAVILTLAVTAIVAGVVGAMLALVKRLKRANQTLAALFGTSVILFVPGYPLLLWMNGLREAGRRSDLAETLWLLLFVWSLFVTAHIFRNALSTRLIGGFFAALALDAVIVSSSYAVRGLIDGTGA